VVLFLFHHTEQSVVLELDVIVCCCGNNTKHHSNTARQQHSSNCSNCIVLALFVVLWAQWLTLDVSKHKTQPQNPGSAASEYRALSTALVNARWSIHNYCCDVLVQT
jgi:hypothetical protein